MNKSQQRQIERLRRVAGFGSRHEKEFAPTSKGHALFTEVVDFLNDIDSIVRKPERGRKGGPGPSEKQQALQQLREELELISTTAKVIEKYNADVAGKFTVPDKRRKDELVATAREFLIDAEIFKADFFSYEMPENFLTNLSNAVAACDGSAGQLSPGLAAKRDLKDILARGQEALEILEVVVHNKYRGNKTALAEWKMANRL